MTSTSFLPAISRPGGRPRLRRAAAWLAARACDPRAGRLVVIQFAVLHAVLWTLILINLKAAQDIHMDVAEGFAWGQKFLFGYGKHPPLAGWVAGMWFKFFPAENWSTYALAMTTVSLGLIICWFIAVRVVDRRRAFMVVVMLALYPIFNFKGFKYNPDLLQLVTLPLVVLAYLNAFEKRSVLSGIWLGLAGALALMTKYWVLTMIGAVGLAALLHPDRLAFLRSPAPWVAIATLFIAMTPHLIWLYGVRFAPLFYAGGVYSLTDYGQVVRLVLGYVAHNLALLALPVALASLALVLAPGWRETLAKRPGRLAWRSWARGANTGVNRSQALNVWIIQSIVAVGPLLGALAFTIYLKTDWGISLFFLVPLALAAIPTLRVPKAALFNLAAIWLVLSVATLAGSHWIARAEMAANPNNSAIYGARAELARELTRAWNTRFASRWPIVAGTMENIEPLSFYSPDHPVPFTPGEPWSSGLTSEQEVKRLGFIAVFDPADWRLPSLEKWIAEAAPNAERIVMTTRRFFHGRPGPTMIWHVYIVAPSS